MSPELQTLSDEWHATLLRLRAFPRPIPKAMRADYERERLHWEAVGNQMDSVELREGRKAA